MTRCLDEGKLQSYFDGELSIDMMESVTSHLASCVTCAAAAREMEEESALLTSALAMEFEASVPSERLRERINEAVLGDRIASAQSTQKAGFFSGLLNFGTQRTLGYAGLAVVIAFAAIAGIVKMTTTPDQGVTKDQVANNTTGVPVKTEVVATASTKEEPTVPPIEVSAPPTKAPTVGTPRKEYRSIPVSTAPKPASVRLIPGERSYLQAIARLDSTIKSNQKDMRPALQAEYQRNLVVVDRAIAATRSAAKSNPNDPDAADFMFAAYQSKVDLLNTIADARVGGGRGH
jgi:anti-sigma factor RsiW